MITAEQERERIVALLGLWQAHESVGVSISMSEFIAIAIKGEKYEYNPVSYEKYMGWLGASPTTIITSDGDDGGGENPIKSSSKPRGRYGGAGLRPSKRGRYPM